MRRFMKTLLSGLWAIVIALGVQTGWARDASLTEQLNAPGVHAIMRHALAPGTGDPANFALRDCSTQRNLDDRGREQAIAIGRGLKQSGATFDRVLTSQWCRCIETAQLLDLAEPEEFAPLNSFFRDRSTADQQTRELRAFLASRPADEHIMLVTHQVNITALTGRYPASGEVFLIRMNDNNEAVVIGSFLIQP